MRYIGISAPSRKTKDRTEEDNTYILAQTSSIVDTSTYLQIDVVPTLLCTGAVRIL